MTVSECLAKMDEAFEAKGCKPGRDKYGSSMSHAHQVVKDGLAAYVLGNYNKAVFSLGFAYGRMVGLGVFPAELLKLLAKEIGESMYTPGGGD